MVALSAVACGASTLSEVTDAVEVCRDAHILAWAAFSAAMHAKPGSQAEWGAEAVSMIACGWEPPE